MFSIPKYEVSVSSYRKKLDTDKDNERTGDYVFKFVQSVPVDVTIDLSSLPKNKQHEVIQKLIVASENGDKVTLMGVPQSKRFKNGEFHSLLLQDFEYKPVQLQKAV